MDKSEEVFVSLFSSLREDLREEYGVGLALKAEGRNITLRVRSEKKPGDEKQPHFALVVGVRDGAFRISYKPSGVPSAESQVTIVGADATDRAARAGPGIRREGAATVDGLSAERPLSRWPTPALPPMIAAATPSPLARHW
jgi:hypothetical protein